MAKDELGVFDIESIPLKTLLFQTGYLTITGYDKQLGLHILDFPNQEVKKSFIRSLMQHLTKKEGADVITFAANLKKALLAYDLDLFFKYIRIFFASIPYTVHVRIEKFYQAIFYVMIKMLGAEIEITVEEATNIGRIDAVIQTDKHTYIIECKVDDSPAVAIAQIERTKYYEKFMMSGKEIVLIGLSFDTKERNVVHQVKILHDT
jgi:hypothetical protein